MGSTLLCRPGEFKFLMSHKTLSSEKTKGRSPFYKTDKKRFLQWVGTGAEGAWVQGYTAQPRPGCVSYGDPPNFGYFMYIQE